MTRINIAILERIHVMIQKIFQKYDVFMLITEIYEENDLNLMAEGTIILARNLIFCLTQDTSQYFLDYNFLDNYTHHTLAKI